MARKRKTRKEAVEASFGVPAFVPEPVTALGGTDKRRSLDKDGNGEKSMRDLDDKDSGLKTKAGMMNEILKSLSGMKKEDVAKLRARLRREEDEKDDDGDDHVEIDVDTDDDDDAEDKDDKKTESRRLRREMRRRAAARRLREEEDEDEDEDEDDMKESRRRRRYRKEDMDSVDDFNFDRDLDEDDDEDDFYFDHDLDEDDEDELDFNFHDDDDFDLGEEYEDDEDEDDMKESRRRRRLRREEEDEDEKLDEEEDEDEDEDDGKKEESRKFKKLRREDLNFHYDIANLFEGNQFTPEFTSKTKEIFESAVLANVNENLMVMDKKLRKEQKADVRRMRRNLVEQLDKYLTYVTGHFMKENRIAIESGLKMEQYNSFMGGLKRLFNEHYVSVNNREAKLVNRMSRKIDALESQLSKEITNVASLSEKLENERRNRIFEKVTGNLADTQKARLKNLVEGVDFKNEADFERRIVDLKKAMIEGKITQQKSDAKIMVVKEDNEKLMENIISRTAELLKTD